MSKSALPNANHDVNKGPSCRQNDEVPTVAKNPHHGLDDCTRKVHGTRWGISRQSFHVEEVRGPTTLMWLRAMGFALLFFL